MALTKKIKILGMATQIGRRDGACGRVDCLKDNSGEPQLRESYLISMNLYQAESILEPSEYSPTQLTNLGVVAQKTAISGKIDNMPSNGLER